MYRNVYLSLTSLKLRFQDERTLEKRKAMYLKKKKARKNLKHYGLLPEMKPDGRRYLNTR